MDIQQRPPGCYLVAYDKAHPPYGVAPFMLSVGGAFVSLTMVAISLAVVVEEAVVA